MSKARDIADSTTTLDVDGGTIKLDGNYPVGTNNVALGDTALDSIASGGTRNTAIGFAAGTALTTQDYNVFVGPYSGDGATGSSNVAVGDVTLRNTSGSFNTAIGGEALTSNTTASDNTAVGYQALYANTTASGSVAVGRASAASNTTGVNTSVGDYSLNSNTTGSNNTALGKQALQLNTTASNNTAVGYQAGYSQTTADSFGSNTFIGQYAGYSTTGSRNSFLGAGAGNAITSGARNTIIGRYNGNENGLDIRTSSNNIVLSDGDGNPQTWIQGNGSTNHYGHASSLGDYIATWNMRGTNTDGLQAFYNGVTPNNTSRYFFRGKDATAKRVIIYSNGNIVNANNSYGSISDVKLKENIVDASSQWDDIKALTVRKYSMKADSLDAPNMLGVIAQELETAGMGGLVFESPDKDADNNDLGTVTKQVNYSILYMKAVKALQEAMDRIETLEAKVTALEAN